MGYDHCDICFSNDKILNIVCCKGKKWCVNCKEKCKSKFSLCPFCRSNKKSITAIRICNNNNMFNEGGYIIETILQFNNYKIVKISC